MREMLHNRGLDRARLKAEPRAFGRYEAARPNERWIGDVLVAPWVPHPRWAGSRQDRLFLLVDDHSRLLVHSSWCSNENTRAGQRVLRAAITRRVITGEVGIGKTVAVRAATDGLDPTSRQVIYIANPAFGTRGLYLSVGPGRSTKAGA